MQNLLSHLHSMITHFFLKGFRNLTQKFFLIVCLLCGILNAEGMVLSSKDSQWQSFFGVEAGAGIYGVFPAIFLSVNPSFSPEGNAFGLGYSFGISGGWQKYTYEKVGIRNTFGFLFSYIPDLGSIRKADPDSCLFCHSEKPTDFKGISGQGYNFYYALDGVFDFLKNNDVRFGMIFGVRLGLTGTSGQNGLNGFLIQMAPRLGLYIKNENSIFDLTFSFPVEGAGAGDIIYDAPFMLGYKHLF